MLSSHGGFLTIAMYHYGEIIIKLKHSSKTRLCPQRNFGRHIVIALFVRSSNSCPVHNFLYPIYIYIFFEVGNPNLVCGCILGCQSVAYHFRVTVTLTLTSDIVFIVVTMSVRPSRFMSGAYLLYSLR